MIPAAAALGLVALVRLRGRALAAFLLVAGAAATAFSLYYWSVFRVASPLALYGGVPADAQALTWRSLAGLFLDRSFGLLPIAPVFLLALAGLPALLLRREAWPHVLVGLAVLAPLLSWRMWWGGQCPPARFLVPMLPLLAVALALRLARARTGLARWWPGLFVTGLVLSAWAVAEPAARLLLNRGNRPTRLWAALSGDVAIGDYLPTLTHASERDARLALVWLIALGLLLVLDRLAESRPRVDRAFGSFAVAVLAVLVARRGDRPDRGTAPRRRADSGAHRRTGVRGLSPPTRFRTSFHSFSTEELGKTLHRRSRKEKGIGNLRNRPQRSGVRAAGAPQMGISSTGGAASGPSRGPRSGRRAGEPLRGLPRSRRRAGSSGRG